MLNPVTVGNQIYDMPVDINNYWSGRRNHDLYRFTVALAKGMFYDAKSAIDVGSYTSGLLCELDWIPDRLATDLQAKLTKNWEHVPGIKFVAGDAFTLDLGMHDLVISNQTIEHLEDPVGFVDKLLSIGRGLIISTTYEVPSGTIEGHVQDPISFEKFRSWFPCELDAWLICHHPSNRLLKHIVGVIRQSHPNAKKR